MNKTYVILTILSVLSMLETGLCVDCHQCASKDGGCSDPYDEDNVDGCDDRDTHCYKTKIVSRLQDSGFILGEPRETVVVTRGCVRADNEGDGCIYIQADAGFMFKCLCSLDSCNSGTSVVSNILLMLLTAIAALWFRRGA